MKKIKSIVLFGFLMSFFLINVHAKNTLLTCEYYKAADTLSPYPGNQQVGILCDIYDNYTHQCYMEVGSESASRSSNKEKIQNWGTTVGLSWKAKDYVKNNNKCPDFLSIRLKNGAIFNIGGYEIYAAENMESIIELNKKLKGQRYSATLKGMQISNEKKKQAENNVKNYTESINSQINTYSISTCAKDEKIITKYEKCKQILSNLKSNISSWDVNVHNYINQGYFNENDIIIKNYREAVKNANSFFYQSEKELEEKNKEIQEELNLNKPNNNGNNHNSNNNTQNSGENVLKFCSEPKIQKTFKFLGILLFIIKILIPILLIVLGATDYAKVVVSSDSDAISKSTKALMIRIFAGIVIFLIPTIINFAFSLIQNADTTFNDCRICLFDPNNCKTE